MQLKVSRKGQLYFPYLAAAQGHIQGTGGLADHIKLLGGAFQCGDIAAGFHGRNGSVIRNGNFLGAVFAAGGNIQEHAVQGAGAAGNFFQENAVGDGDIAVHRNRAVHRHPMGVQLGAVKIIVRLSGRLQSQGVVFKLPAVAAVILGAALGANGVAVFIDHQSCQHAQGNGGRSGGWCGESDRKITATIIVISCTWCPIF